MYIIMNSRKDRNAKAAGLLLPHGRDQRLQIQNGLRAFPQTLNLPKPSALPTPHPSPKRSAERPTHPSHGDVDGGVHGAPRLPVLHVLGGRIGGGGEGGQEVRNGGGGRLETQGGQEEGPGGSEQPPRDHAAGAGLGRPEQVRRRRPHLPLRRPQDRLGLRQGQLPPEPSEQEGDPLRREAQNHL